uniref:Putative c2h2-type zn-finger protein n=1 Tax=Lutzomyia longipalpis TaxID=7200 RepID=A0A7G3AEK9_LUTLO
MCREIFRDLEDFEAHIGAHGVLKLKSYTCLKCSEDFVTLNQLNDHFGKHIEDTKKEFCGTSSCCSQKQDKSSFSDGKKMISICLMCKRVFLKREAASEHLMKQHKITYDDQRISLIRDIPAGCLSQCQRLKGENSKNACICMICKKVFVNKYTCITHVNTHHGGKISCRSVNYEGWYKSLEEDDEDEIKSSSRGNELISGRSADAPHECCLCGQVLSRKSSCMRHLIRQHGIDGDAFCSDPLNFCRKLQQHPEKRSHQPPTKTICLLCYRVFQKKYNCFQHLLKKHSRDVKSSETPGELFVQFLSEVTKEVEEEIPEKDSKITEKKTTKEKLQCHICAALLKSSTSLRRHIMSRHTDSPPQLPCNICNKTFHTQQSLKHHKMIMHHQQEPPPQHICLQCDKIFSTAQILQQHHLIHTGDKPFECSLCQKTFRLKSSLENHMKIHSDERPFQCNFCQKRFKIRKDCKNHERTHTGQRPFKCRHCGKDFGHSSARYNHEKTHSATKVAIGLSRAHADLTIGHSCVIPVLGNGQKKTDLRATEPIRPVHLRANKTSRPGNTRSVYGLVTLHLRTRDVVRDGQC